MIEIRHTRADGTLADGTVKGDGSGDILKRNGFRWFPSLGCFGIIQSRDKAAKTWKINTAAQALRDAGFEVTVTIDEDDARSFEEAEAERIQRAEDRAERFADRADRAAARSDSRYQASHAVIENIPPGQPILVGHHSERGHRRALARSDAHMRAAIDEGKKADYYEQRADASENYRRHREDTGTTLRRIEKLEADERFWVKTLETGSNSSGWTTSSPKQVAEIERRLAEVREKLEYWRGVIKEQEANGVKLWSKADFSKGDYVHTRGRWYPVVRVNAKSVSIPNPLYDGPAWTVPYHEVDGRRSAEEIEAAREAAEAAKESA